MINHSCANKQPGATTIHWGYTVEHNEKGGTKPSRKENGHERGTFERVELRYGRIQVTSQEEGVNWKCASCVYNTDTGRKLRNLLSVMRRHTNIGDVSPYCGKTSPYGKSSGTHRRVCRAQMQKSPEPQKKGQQYGEK